jgi:hypothetical protein
MPRRVRSAGFVAREPQPIEKKPLPNLEQVLGQRRRDAEQKEAAEKERRKAAVAAVIKPAEPERKEEVRASAARVVPPANPEAAARS